MTLAARRASASRPSQTTKRSPPTPPDHTETQTAGAKRPGRSQSWKRILEEGDVGRPRPLGALDDVELHPLALVQGAIALHADLRVVDEHVRAALTSEETETLGLVE